MQSIDSSQSRKVKFRIQHTQQTSQWCVSLGKRAFDLVCASLLFVLLAPVMLLVALAVKLSSEGPVFFRQRRVGQNGREFDILKFRTMRANRSAPGPGLTTVDDARLTPIGRALRRWKMDEFPQLINVLRGQMSFVGPRPKLPHLELQNRGSLVARPGITGMATLAFRHEEALLEGLSPEQIEDFYVKTIAPLKVQLDLDYQRRATFKSDLKIMFQTIFCVFRSLQGVHYHTREQLPQPSAYPAQVALDRRWDGVANRAEA